MLEVVVSDSDAMAEEDGKDDDCLYDPWILALIQVQTSNPIMGTPQQEYNW